MALFSKGEKGKRDDKTIRNNLYNSLRALHVLLLEHCKEFPKGEKNQRTVELHIFIWRALPIVRNPKTPLYAIVNTLPSILLEINKISQAYKTSKSKEIQDILRIIQGLILDLYEKKKKSDTIENLDSLLEEPNKRLAKSHPELKFREAKMSDLKGMAGVYGNYPEDLGYEKHEFEGYLRLASAGGNVSGIVLVDSRGKIKGIRIGYDARFFPPSFKYQIPDKFKVKTFLLETSAISPELRGDRGIDFLGSTLRVFEEALRAKGYKNIILFPANEKLIELHSRYRFKVYEKLQGPTKDSIEYTTSAEWLGVALMYKEL